METTTIFIDSIRCDIEAKGTRERKLILPQALIPQRLAATRTPTTKLTQMATTCYLNLYSTIYCYCIVFGSVSFFLGHRARLANPTQFAILRFCLAQWLLEWSCVNVLERISVCVCVSNLHFICMPNEIQMAISCDLWGESEENWTLTHSLSLSHIYLGYT